MTENRETAPTQAELEEVRAAAERKTNAARVAGLRDLLEPKEAK